MTEVREYVDDRDRSPFKVWFDRLDTHAATKVTTTLIRMEQGNLSNPKSVGSGVFESRIHYGPGYRIYFGRDGAELIVLLGGGTKGRQQQDIEKARDRWEDYRQRKKKGG